MFMYRTPFYNHCKIASLAIKEALLLGLTCLDA